MSSLQSAAVWHVENRSASRKRTRSRVDKAFPASSFQVVAPPLDIEKVTIFFPKYLFGSGRGVGDSPVAVKGTVAYLANPEGNSKFRKINIWFYVM